MKDCVSAEEEGARAVESPRSLTGGGRSIMSLGHEVVEWLRFS